MFLSCLPYSFWTVSKIVGMCGICWIVCIIVKMYYWLRFVTCTCVGWHVTKIDGKIGQLFMKHYHGQMKIGLKVLLFTRKGSRPLHWNWHELLVLHYVSYSFPPPLQIYLMNLHWSCKCRNVIGTELLRTNFSVSTNTHMTDIDMYTCKILIISMSLQYTHNSCLR